MVIKEIEYLREKNTIIENIQEGIINAGVRFFRQAEINEMSVSKLIEICAANQIDVFKTIKIKDTMGEITVEDFRNKNFKLISILTYVGSGDPVENLNTKIKEHTKGKQYHEFIDMNMDNPWTRNIVFDGPK